MEAETIPTLIGGFSGVIILTLLCIVILWGRNKRFAYFWFIGQVLFLILGFKSLLRIMDLTQPSSMVSEEISLTIGVSALFWAMSMICMLIGIWCLSRLTPKDKTKL
jgi:hypothetical protein